MEQQQTTITTTWMHFKSHVAFFGKNGVSYEAINQRCQLSIALFSKFLVNIVLKIPSWTVSLNGNTIKKTDEILHLAPNSLMDVIIIASENDILYAFGVNDDILSCHAPYPLQVLEVLGIAGESGCTLAELTSVVKNGASAIEYLVSIDLVIKRLVHPIKRGATSRFAVYHLPAFSVAYDPSLQGLFFERDEEDRADLFQRMYMLLEQSGQTRMKTVEMAALLGIPGKEITKIRYSYTQMSSQKAGPKLPVCFKEIEDGVWFVEVVDDYFTNSIPVNAAMGDNDGFDDSYIDTENINELRAEVDFGSAFVRNLLTHQQLDMLLAQYSREGLSSADFQRLVGISRKPCRRRVDELRSLGYPCIKSQAGKQVVFKVFPKETTVVHSSLPPNIKTGGKLVKSDTQTDLQVIRREFILEKLRARTDGYNLITPVLDLYIDIRQEEKKLRLMHAMDKRTLDRILSGLSSEGIVHFLTANLPNGLKVRGTSSIKLVALATGNQTELEGALERYIDSVSALAKSRLKRKDKRRKDSDEESDEDSDEESDDESDEESDEESDDESDEESDEVSVTKGGRESDKESVEESSSDESFVERPTRRSRRKVEVKSPRSRRRSRADSSDSDDKVDLASLKTEAAKVALQPKVTGNKRISSNASVLDSPKATRNTKRVSFEENLEQNDSDSPVITSPTSKKRARTSRSNSQTQLSANDDANDEGDVMEEDIGDSYNEQDEVSVEEVTQKASKNRSRERAKLNEIVADEVDVWSSAQDALLLESFLADCVQKRSQYMSLSLAQIFNRGVYKEKNGTDSQADESATTASSAPMKLSDMYHPAFSLMQQNPRLSDVTSVHLRLPIPLLKKLGKLPKFTRTHHTHLVENETLDSILAKILTEQNPIDRPFLTSAESVDALNSVLDPELYATQQSQLVQRPKFAHLEEAAWTRALQVYCDPNFWTNDESDIQLLDSLSEFPSAVMARVHREMYCNSWIVPQTQASNEIRNKYSTLGLFRVTDSFWRMLEARHSGVFDELLDVDQGDDNGAASVGFETYFRQSLHRQAEQKTEETVDNNDDDENNTDDVNGLLSMVVCHLVSSQQNSEVGTKITSFNTEEPPPEECPGPVVSLATLSDSGCPLYTVNAKKNHSNNSFGRPLCRVRCELSLKLEPLSATPQTIRIDNDDDEVDPLDDTSSTLFRKLESLILKAGNTGIKCTALHRAGLMSSFDSLVVLLLRAEKKGAVIILRGPNRLRLPKDVLSSGGRRLSSLSSSHTLETSVIVHRDFAHLYTVVADTNDMNDLLSLKKDQLRCPWVTLSGEVNVRLLSSFRNRVLSLLLDYPGSTFARVHSSLVLLTLEQTQSLLNRLDIDENLIYHEDCFISTHLTSPWQKVEYANADDNITSTHYFIKNQM